MTAENVPDTDGAYATDRCVGCGNYAPSGLCDECRAQVEANGEHTPAGWTPPPNRSSRPFPTLHPGALHGPAGRFVEVMGPVSEAHPAALLFEYLATFGCAAGGGPRLNLSGNLQLARLFVAIVGDSSHARKSASRSRVKQVFDRADPEFSTKRCFKTPSSAEGLLELVRDDDSRPDRRALLNMPELAKLFRTMERSGTTMSPLLREAFDVGTLRVIRRVDPLVATDPHISIVGNITGPELFGLMQSVDIWNGFANRFLFIMARAVQELPFGAEPDTPDLNQLISEAAHALDHSRRGGTITWGTAREMWPDAYHELRRPEDGPLGAILARRDTHVIRLMIDYAMLDGTGELSAEHLTAAMHAWDYCEESARYQWEHWGDTDAYVEGLRRNKNREATDRVGRILTSRRPGEFLSRSELHNLFWRNIPTADLARIMDQLVAAGAFKTAVRNNDAPGRTAHGWERT